MQHALAILSALITLISPLVYARAIFRGEAKPHRTTRLVLLLISILATASLFASHNTVAIWLAAATVIQAVGIFLLSIKYGMGGGNRIDVACLVVALAGIIAWRTTSNPLLGLYFSILADFTGMIPALLKTYRFPKTEIATFFALDILAAICSLLATNIYSISNIAYPLYIFLINGAMVTLILWPRKSKVVT